MVMTMTATKVTPRYTLGNGHAVTATVMVVITSAIPVLLVVTLSRRNIVTRAAFTYPSIVGLALYHQAATHCLHG